MRSSELVEARYDIALNWPEDDVVAPLPKEGQPMVTDAHRLSILV
jgi:hypothetical protein